jgi:VIT1/CCC1 family predicted Fe2+/Mn2+ transporter
VVPDELPSPWTAALSSFVCFAIGAVIPLLTYLLGFDSLWLALGVGSLGLFLAGAVVARFTGRSWLLSGFRQFALGALAAVATYGIGALIGVGVA